MLCGLRDLSSPTRHRTRAHGSESAVHNYLRSIYTVFTTIYAAFTLH